MKNNQETTLQSATNAGHKNNATARKAALAAAGVAGAVGVGGAAGYAATALNEEEVEVEEAVTEEPVVETPPAEEPEPEVVERVVVREVPVQVEDDEQASGLNLSEADVDVLSVGQADGGGFYAQAEVNGHAAVFVDGDENGIVEAVGIDLNDNQQLEEAEILDVSDRNISMTDLALAVDADQQEEQTPGPVVNHDDEHHDGNVHGGGPVPPQNPEELDASQVEVEAVVTDVDYQGHQVNMAAVSYGGHAGVAIDADQDNDADVVAIDLNDNSEFESNEFYSAPEGAVVMEADANIPVGPDPVPEPEPEPLPEPMPEPEPEYYEDPNAGTDGLPDYTNDGDVDGYII